MGRGWRGDASVSGVGVAGGVDGEESGGVSDVSVAFGVRDGCWVGDRGDPGEWGDVWWVFIICGDAGERRRGEAVGFESRRADADADAGGDRDASGV